MLGQERILTARSGDFGWFGENTLAQAHVFDELGREVPDYPVETIATPNGARMIVNLKSDHCASRVTLPFDAELHGVSLHRITVKQGILTGTAKGNGTVYPQQGRRKQNLYGQ